jgi:hypothetical protein
MAEESTPETTDTPAGALRLPPEVMRELVKRATDLAEPEYECYADSLSVNFSSYTVGLVFGQVGVSGTIQRKAVVRLSPEHAKMIALVLRKLLKQQEQKLGYTIALPPAALTEKGISLESDW